MIVQYAPVIRSFDGHAKRCILSCARQSESIGELNFGTVAYFLGDDGGGLAWCKSLGIECKRIDCAPSQGSVRKAVWDKFLLSSGDALVQLEQNLFLYPRAGERLQSHLSQYPSTDLLVTKPKDVITLENPNPDASNCFRVGDRWTQIWTTHNVTLGYRCGPGRHPYHEDPNNGFGSQGIHIFKTRKLIESLQHLPPIEIFDNINVELNALRLHQRGDIVFMLTFLSDFLVEDWSATFLLPQASAEAVVAGGSEIVRSLNLMSPGRSSFEELPVRFPQISMSVSDKLKYLEDKTI